MVLTLDLIRSMMIVNVRADLLSSFSSGLLFLSVLFYIFLVSTCVEVVVEHKTNNFSLYIRIHTVLEKCGDIKTKD